MKKDEKIFIKLGLEKNQTSGEITLNIQFDQTAPNFIKEKDTLWWQPTFEEWSYATEAFNILAKGQDFPEGNRPQFESGPGKDYNTANEHEIVDKYLEKNKTA